MNRALYTSFVLALILSACSKKGEASYAYRFYEDKELLIESDTNGYMQYASLQDGQNRVFEYQYTAQDEEYISDDEYSEFIRFEIDPALSSFTYQDSGLISINAVFTKVCFCGFPYEKEKDLAPSGSISGERISESQWDIDMDLTFYGNEHKNIQHRFTRTN